MEAGRLRHKVDVEKLSDVPDGQGGQTRTWTKALTTWADIRPIDSHEGFYAGQNYPGVTHAVRMRYSTEIKLPCRIKFGSRYLSIIGVRDRQERGEELMLMCSERQS